MAEWPDRGFKWSSERTFHRPLFCISSQQECQKAVKNKALRHDGNVKISLSEYGVYSLMRREFMPSHGVFPLRPYSFPSTFSRILAARKEFSHSQAIGYLQWYNFKVKNQKIFSSDA